MVKFKHTLEGKLLPAKPRAFIPHQPPSNHIEEANKVLEDFDDCCKVLDIKYVLILGTALGMYRDKGFIKGDHDIDVGLLCDDEKTVALYKKLGEKGFHHGGWGCHDNFHIYRGHIMVDVWTKFLYKFRYKGRLDTITYNGRKYFVPHPIEWYLKEHYGNGWKKRR